MITMEKSEVVEFPKLPGRQEVESAVAVEEGSVGALVKAALEVTIRTDADQETATVHLRFLKERRDKIDLVRKSMSLPFDRAAKAINAVFRPVLDKLDQAEATLKGRYAAYVDQQERLREEALERQRRAEEKVASQAPPGVTVIPREAPEPVARTVHAGGATTSIKKGWTFEVVDLEQIPRSYMTVDREAVQARVDQLARALGGKVPEGAIPGVRIFQKTQVAVGRQRGGE